MLAKLEYVTTTTTATTTKTTKTTTFKLIDHDYRGDNTQKKDIKNINKVEGQYVNKQGHIQYNTHCDKVLALLCSTKVLELQL